jgi:hypothetical protein
MITIRLFLFSLLLFLIASQYNALSGQRFQRIEQAEDSLEVVMASLNLATDDSSKNVFNQVFIQMLSDALKLNSSDSYPFEALKTLVKISSPDQKFRIFHWNLPARNGTHRYFGFLKMLNHEPSLVYFLSDVSDSLTFPDTAMLDDKHWFGALYYQVIAGETNTGLKTYTLLGWAGRNEMITQKIIEILWFDEHDKPHFGLKLFPGYSSGNMTRVIFRYAATTTMSLKYEKQATANNKKWNSKKKSFEYAPEEHQMIVCERMMPLDPQLEGQFQFYVPSGDLFDGFIFQNFFWNFIAGIESRNRK